MITKERLAELPTSPGCYLFKNRLDKIIYVGKAKNIRKRVANYFQKKDHDAKTEILVSFIRDVDFIVTKNEVEALLLENVLIKKHYPKYNIDLKDSKRYAYLRLSSGEYPFLEVVRTREWGGELYGPFVSGKMRKYIQEVLTRNFGILIRRPSPRFKKKIDRREYLRRVSEARQILRGKVDELIKEFKENMRDASKKTHFEYALSLRERIAALESLKEKQNIELSRSYDAHVLNYVVSNERVYVLVFGIRKGVLEGKQQFSFPYRENFLEEFLSRYYSTVLAPDEIIVPEKISSAFEKYIREVSGRKVKVIVPVRGEKKELMDLVLKNISATFFAGQESLIDLEKMLDLPSVPHVIDCFDISHLGGKNTVASMVMFLNGKPDKSNYRKFRIRVETDGDDYLAIEEVVRRRYKRAIEENLPKPDLIVIDGGKGQLSSAVKVLREIGYSAKIISLAKKFEEIYLPGKKDPLVFSKKRKGLQLLQAVRDEAHRFAIGYNRVLRKRKLFGK